MKIKPPPIRKKPFLLLEILVAFTLVTLLLFPLIRPLLSLRNEERKEFIALELQREAKNRFLELKQAAYEKRFLNFETLYETKKAIEEELGNTVLKLSQEEEIIYKTRCRILKIRGFKRRCNNEAALILKITISFEGPFLKNGESSFSFPLLIERRIK